MNKIALPALACLLFLGLPVRAQQAASAQAAAGSASVDDSATIEVASVRDPALKPYPIMLKGLDAFDDGRAMAPQASLRFLLRAQGANSDLGGVTLRIVGETASIAVPVEADHTFVLPRDAQAARENAEMILNRKKNTVRWRPDIHTPGLPANTRRLGDLRLECAVRWAVEQDEVSFIMRNIFRAAGGPCTSSHITVMYHVPKDAVAATLIAGERRLPVKFEASGKFYSPPLHDRGWNDEARIEFTFRPAMPVSAAPAAAAPAAAASAASTPTSEAVK